MSQKTIDCAIQTPLKTMGEIRYSGRVFNQILARQTLCTVFGDPEGKVGMPLNGLTPPQFCTCPNPEPNLKSASVLVFF